MEKGGEVLVTISSDGKVKEFNFKQGLQSTNLMTLKRIPRSQEENFRWKPLNSKGEGIVSGEESGMCFDFALDNPHIYFCGTSDGYVHSCSCSYNEQYLNTFEGHQASVRSVRAFQSHYCSLQHVPRCCQKSSDTGALVFSDLYTNT